MKYPRRKVIEAHQAGHWIMNMRYQWTCKLACGHEAQYHVNGKNTQAPKTLACSACVRKP